MRKTKIVCTIGPASETVETLKDLIKAGMNVARLNFSHGNFEEHKNRINNIKQASKEMDQTVGILLDTKGPEIRTDKFKDGEATIETGNTVYISMEEVEGTAERFSISYEGLINDLHEGSRILIDDGLIELEVTGFDFDKGEIITKALNNGLVSNNKGVNVPNVKVNLPAMTDKDKEDIIFGIEQNVDFIAPSFIRRQSDVLVIKQLLEENNGGHIHIIPKIENQEGVDNIKEILEISDGIMVARGDLGVEIPAEDVPLVQKDLIRECNIVGKPVITATQMLDSMQRNPRPTRAEASDVANAILDGTDAIMLSGETAAGDYPVESVQMMSNIAYKTETGLDNESILKKRSKVVDMTITNAISQSVTHTAKNIEASAIITSTESGFTARMISKYRPKAPIIAVTFSDTIVRQLSLAWGIHALVGPKATSTDEMLDIAIERSLSTNIFTRGSRVVITAGVPIGESGTTNLMKVHVIGDVIAKGQGIGEKSAYGRIVTAKNAQEAIDKMSKGDILLTYATDRDMMPAIELAGGIVVEEGGLTSHAAVVGLSLGIPVIVGLKQGLERLVDGTEVTLDATVGHIFEGHASVL